MRFGTCVENTSGPLLEQPQLCSQTSHLAANPHFGPNRLGEHLNFNDLSTNVNERDVWVKGVYKVTDSFSTGGMCEESDLLPDK